MRLGAWTFLLVVALTSPAAAQVDERLLKQIETHTLDNIRFAMCDEKTRAKCQPATAAERASYPLPREISEAVVLVAFRSLIVHACGSDYVQLTFRPMMRDARRSRKFSSRQLAFMGFQHGIAFGVFERTQAAQCTPEWQSFVDQLEASQ